MRLQYILNNGVYKVVDSHSKNLIGQNDPFCSCTLIKIETLNELLYYFQQLHAQQFNFELRGIKFLDMPNSNINDNSTDVSNPFLYDECFVIALYPLCFSTVKSCRYWNDETIKSTVENAKLLHEKLCFTKQRAHKLAFPSKLDIGMGHVNIAAGTKCKEFFLLIVLAGTILRCVF